MKMIDVRAKKSHGSKIKKLAKNIASIAKVDTSLVLNIIKYPLINQSVSSLFGKNIRH